ncbi:MAG: ABC transporter permease [Actinobacteria bacterium]|nr:ABC transporter permease [Actinomycetota bacterium]
MKRLRYIGWRLVQMIPVLLGATIVLFLMVRALPGDPAATLLGVHATPEQLAQLREHMGLDRPIPVQYALFLRDLVTGNLGESLTMRTSVGGLIWDRIGTTLLLVGMTVAMSVGLAVPLAALAALTRDRSPDKTIRLGMTLGMGMPQFWVALLLMLIFSITLHLLPVAGYGDSFPGHVQHLILPALTLALSMAAILTRPLRADIIRVMQSGFVEVAQAKGVRTFRLLSRHVMRNAVIGTITILGVQVGWLLSGTVVVEVIFALPGLGSLLTRSVLSRDYPTIQGVAFVFVVLVLLVNLITDVVYSYLDPRVKLG